MVLLTAPRLEMFVKQTARLTTANLKSRYRKTFAGFLWVILNPLIMFGVQSFIFSKVLNIQMPNYYMFLLSGLLPWIFMVQAIEMCTPMLQYSGHLLKAFPVHPLVYLTAQLVDNVINFIVAFLVILIPLALFDPGPHWRFMLLPLPLLVLLAGVSGITWLLATTQVFLRDTRYITTFVLNVSFFLTPIFYPVEFIPEEFRWMASINPFYTLIAPFQTSIAAFSPELFWLRLGKAALLSAGLLLAAAWVWRLKKNDLYFHV